MKKMFRIYLLLIVISIFSCGSPKYGVTHQNVMQFEKKGDLNIGGGLSDIGLFGNVGYSITNNIGVTTNFDAFGGSYTVDGETKKDYFWENELVLYHKVGKYFYPAINLGYGFGTIYNNSNVFYTDINRFFGQPSLSFHSKYLDVSISTRISKVKHNIVQYNDVNKNLYGDVTVHDHYRLGTIGREPFVFVEPALSLGLHWEGIRFTCQYVHVNKVKGGDIKIYNGPIVLQLDFRLNLPKNN